MTKENPFSGREAEKGFFGVRAGSLTERLRESMEAIHLCYQRSSLQAANYLQVSAAAYEHEVSNEPRWAVRKKFCEVFFYCIRHDHQTAR